MFDYWLDWIFWPVSTVILFTAFTFAEQRRWPSAGTVHDLTAAALAAAAVVVALWMLGEPPRRGVIRTWAARTWAARIWAARIGVAVICAGAAAFLLRGSGQLAFGARLALAALAFVIVAHYALRQTTHLVRSIRTARWQRGEAETSVLSALLDLLGELMVLQQRRDAEVRRAWMADLERVGVIVERDLPHALRSGDPDSQSAIAAHTRSAAAALRAMKQAVALPGEASWQDLVKQLTGLAVALARHDFGTWPPPQPEVIPARPPQPLWRQVMDVVRTLLVIFAPPLVAYLLPLVVPLTGPGVSWLRFASIVWALLGCLIALDPAWTDRMAKMRQGLDLLRNATPPKGAESSALPYGLADADAPLTADTPRSAAAQPPRARPRSRR